MKNPEAKYLGGPHSPDGFVAGVSAEGALSNKYAPGDPGLSGQTDVNWASVAPVRFKRDEPLPTRYALGEVPD